MPTSPPKRLAERRPDPVGRGGGFSLALAGFGEVARVGPSEDGFLGMEGFLEVASSVQGMSTSIGPDAVVTEAGSKGRGACGR